MFTLRFGIIKFLSNVPSENLDVDHDVFSKLWKLKNNWLNQLFDFYRVYKLEFDASVRI